MDPKFQYIFDDIYGLPDNEIFKVVFYPDRVYHAAYFNATRSSRYRYNVTEVRNVHDIMILKAEVFMDGVYFANVLRVEYRASRLTEVAREKGRFLRQNVLADLKLWNPAGPDGQGPQTLLKLHYDKWINAYQAEIWDDLEPAPGKHHDFRVLDQIGHAGPITSVAAFGDLLHDIKSLKKLEISFRENDIDLPFGYTINDAQWDNAYLRTHQAPIDPAPSSDKNTIHDNCYLVDFQRAHFIQQVDTTINPVQYRNGMMLPGNPEARDNNIIRMQWIFQREFASTVVFFHKVTIPPGTIEGTHRHIGTEELYFVIEGEGVAYIGDGDDPALNDDAKYPLVDREIYGLGTRKCRQVSVQAGSTIYTKSGGIHGIRNNSDTKDLKFVAFLYHTS